MTLEDLRNLFYDGYDDKARIDVATGLGCEELENVRINDPALNPYLSRKIIGLIHLSIGRLEVIVE